MRSTLMKLPRAIWTVALLASCRAALAAVTDPSAGKDWDLTLRDGYASNEGTLLVRFGATWGLLCDDGWGSQGADVACRQLGFGRSLEYAIANKYNTRLDGLQIVLDDVLCTGRESRLSECRARPLGGHNCRPREAAGVRCAVIERVTAAAGANPDWNPLGLAGVDIRLLKDIAKPQYKLHQLRSNNVSAAASGAVVAVVDDVAGGLCPDRVTLREGNVLCRELGLGFAKSVWTNSLSDLQIDGQAKVANRSVLTAGNCRGGEKRLSQCSLYGSGLLGSPCAAEGVTVGLTCARDLPDLAPDARALQMSAYATKLPLFYMTCAMEENCASRIAFEVRKSNPHWQYESRTLLRFSAIVANKGTADFLPVNTSESWSWHSCHMHYHSMPYFAAYEVYRVHNGTHQTVASGHKASFCLQDSACKRGASPRFKCSNNPLETGVQGISAGCSDNYLHDLDCQWVDITDIAYGYYQFRTR